MVNLTQINTDMEIRHPLINTMNHKYHSLCDWIIGQVSQATISIPLQH